MTLDGPYEPSTSERVRDQVARYEASSGREANTNAVGLPVVIVTMRGASTGKVRKIALMRVAHGGSWALVASYGGSAAHPHWYWNLKAHPDEVVVQDGAVPVPVTVRELEGDERAEWWARSVEAFPPYAEYQERTERLIPVFLATPTTAI